MKYLTAIAGIFCLCTGYAQTVLPPALPAYTAVNTYSVKFADAFSGAGNQALLSSLPEPVAGVYCERRFMLKELAFYAAAVTWPLQRSGLGMSIQYFGGQLFNISSVGIGYGRKLDEKIAIGMQFNYLSVHTAGYGNNNTCNAELGLLWQATESLYFGVHVYNLAGKQLNKTIPDKPATVFKVGLGYDISDKAFTSIEIEKTEDRPAGFNTGIQYIFARQFIGRIAIITGNSSYCVGLGWQWKYFRADIVSSWHPQLGLTPSLMLLFRFKDDKEEEGHEKD